MGQMAQALRLGMAIAVLAWGGGAARAEIGADPAVRRGEYLFTAAGCGVCHTDTSQGAPPLAGGRAIQTAFGTFVTPNITPDPVYGIGAWSDMDFIKALRLGIAPDGHDYYPIFPYTTYTGLSDRDMLDLKAYLLTQPAIAQPNQPHALKFPYSLRFGLVPWKLLYFRSGPFTGDAAKPREWNRGAYLVTAITACAECHSPRNFLGAIVQSRRFAGGPGAPDLTPHPQALGSWSSEDLVTLLKTGITPNGDYVTAGMAESVAGTQHLSDADQRSIALFLKSLAPIAPLPLTPRQSSP